MGFMLSGINKIMSKHEKQYQIRTKERADTAEADRWLASQGLSASSFQSTPVRLLQAQRQAHVLLEQHGALLSQEQREKLETYQKRMADRKSRSRLKPKAANEIMNIATKINRQLFKQHRELTRGGAELDSVVG
jgi:hypothetical protein